MSYGDQRRCPARHAGNIRVSILLVVCLVSLASIGQAIDEDIVVRVFRVEHAQIGEVSAAIQPLLSEDGSVTLQPAKGRLTVRDRAGVMAEVSETIKRLDREPLSFRLHVELLEGSRTPISVAGGQEVGKRLKQMFPFKFYRKLGSADLGGLVGDEISVELNEGFSITVTVLDHRMEPTPFGIPNQNLRLDLRPLILERTSSKSTKEILKTRVVLSENQDVVIGAGVTEDSDQGLVLIVKALPEG